MHQYHKGFQSQVSQWPTNPVEVFIAQLKKLPNTLKVADMGCGDAKISQSVLQTVHSFDLVALNAWVTPCDIAHARALALLPRGIDLALLGTTG